MMDRNLIKNQVREVIKYSQGIEDPQVDKILDIWWENKQDIIELFGGELIYELPDVVNITLSEREQQDLLSQFYDKLANNVGYYAHDAVKDFMNNIPADWFFDNSIKEEYTYNGITVPKGMKLTKALKYVFDNKDILDAIQQVASQYIQRAKVTGHFCLSVHPLDFLSSSETTLAWRSCHSLDGEYRAGNFSHMMDRDTIVCYLRADDDVKLPRFPASVPWNDKKWRMLLFVSDERNALFAGRQYPFSSNALMNLARKAFMNCFKNRFCTWTHWHNLYWQDYVFSENLYESGSLSDRWLPMQGKMRCMSKLVVDEPGSLQYDDLLHSTFYTKPYYCWQEPVLSLAHFHIGHEVPCLKCGDKPISGDSTMLCEDCLDEEVEEW